MKSLVSIFIIFSFLTIFITCKKKNSTKNYTPNCSGAKSYINDVAPLINSNCVSCHNTYTNYSAIKTSATSIRNAIIDGSMPKNSS